MHRTILVVDVEGYGDWRRSNPNQSAVRDGVYQAVQSTFDETGIEWAACYCEDRGDGLFVLAPPTIEKALFSGSFPLTLADRLHTHNKTHEPVEGIRLRMALHAGEVDDDHHGVVGSALNQAFRLVDADPLKAALKNSPGVLAVIASSWFYGDVIRQRKEHRPDTYLPVMVNEKETTTIGWVALPDLPTPPPCDRIGTWRVRILDSDGRVHGVGVLVHGRYVITTARAIERSLSLPADSCPPPGQILFDVPKRPHLAIQRAETIWWRPMPDNRGSGLAGLSVAGPALRGIDVPPLRVGPSHPRIVRVHRYLAAENGPAEVKAWGYLPGFSEDTREPIALNPIADFGPYITDECSGADVVDAETGGVLGIALSVPHPGQGVGPAMITIDSIAADWPLLYRIVATAEHGSPSATYDAKAPRRGRRPPAGKSGRPCRVTHADFIRLIDQCLQVPELASAQSRHMMVSELPLEIALTAPRSSVDRADLAALLWTCTRSHAYLTKFRSQVQKKARAGNARQELLKDLGRLVLS